MNSLKILSSAFVFVCFLAACKNIHSAENSPSSKEERTTGQTRVAPKISTRTDLKRAQAKDIRDIKDLPQLLFQQPIFAANQKSLAMISEYENFYYNYTYYEKDGQAILHGRVTVGSHWGESGGKPLQDSSVVACYFEQGRFTGYCLCEATDMPGGQASNRMEAFFDAQGEIDSVSFIYFPTKAIYQGPSATGYDKKDLNQNWRDAALKAVSQ